MTHTLIHQSRLALSELAPGAMQSEIRAMTTECDRIGGINLAQGVCDTPVPEPVEAEAHAAIRAGHNIYTRLDGITRLRNAIAAKQQRDYGLSYDPETEVLVASGATGGLHAAAMALLMLACVSYGMYASNVWAITQTLAGPHAAGKWTAGQNGFANFSGVVGPLVTGWLVEHTGLFSLSFAVAAGVSLTGAAICVFGIGPIEEIQWERT